jgi:pimeloyl-ACP methyl ester carboxylesterase
MSPVEIVVLILVIGLIVLVLGNIVFSLLAERRNPPVGAFVDSAGVRLHYLDRGDPAAPCVVLFHGNGTMIQDFLISGLIELLASRARVVCFDRPGFGHSERPRSRVWTARSQAALFVDVLNRIGIHNPVLLGHSWGTHVAIALALRNDFPVRGLVLASGYYFPTARLDVWMMSGPAVPVLGDLLRYTVAPILSMAMLPKIISKLFAPRSVPPKFMKEFPRSLLLRPKQLRAAAEESALLVPSAAELQTQYSKLSCPVHIFHGSGDQISEPAQSQRLHKAIGRSDLKVVQRAGHMVTYADTSAIAQAAATLAGVNLR